jgi:hypothetical protein
MSSGQRQFGSRGCRGQAVDCACILVDGYLDRYAVYNARRIQ